MDVCIRNPNRTAPVGGACRRGDGPVCSRTNGWTWPPHPLQLLAWMLYVYFAVTVFGVLIPLLPTHWIPAGYICTCVMFASHLCVHLMAVSIDPADSSVRSKTLKGPVPAFDRAKHTHVIEDCHCYLCQVDVGPKSKHCSACNKCVANFDHHCRWLNNCVGSRNYKLFLHSVISALLGVTLVLVVASYVFIEFFVDPSKLRSDKHFLVRNETIVWYVFLPLSPIRSAAAVIPAVAAVTVAMALMSLVLLCHLLCFHLYLMWNRLSTYEYIVRQRHRSRDLMKQGSLKETAQDVNFPGTLGYTNAQLDVEEDTRGEAEFHPNGRVMTVSSPVMEEETTHRVSTEAAGHTQRRTQKKKKKVCKVPAEVNTAPPPAADQGSVSSSVSLGQRIPFPAFPLRASLPQTLPPLTAHSHRHTATDAHTHRHTATDAHTQRHTATDAHTHRHTPPLPGPVQPANPPADYHSDSAESLEEIPMVMAKLGSTSSHTHSHTPSHNTHREGPSHTHINTHSHTLTHTDRPSHTHRNLFPFPTLPSPLPRAKRKASSSRANKTVEMMFEMASAQPPSVCVSRASGGTRPGSSRPSSRMDGPIN